MKNTSLPTKLIMILFFAAVAAYFAVQGMRYFVNPTTTTLTYRYRTEDAISLRGYVVRKEAVIDSSETLLELTHAEGERVAAGSTLATVYRSEDALAQAQELLLMTQQLEQLKYAQSAASDATAALKLDGDIRDDIVALHAATAYGSYTDSLGSELKATVLKRAYAYRGASDLSARVGELSATISSITASLRGTSSTIKSPFAGTYSAAVDGYESVLTPELLETLTPSGFDALSPTAASSTVGKIIKSDEWRFVTVLSEQDAAQLRKNQSLTLRMASGVGFDLPVTVERIGKAEGGRCVLVLMSDDYLSYLTLLREQNAELILHTYEGLRIPKNALRVGEDGKSGVYCLVGLTAYFKPVNILYQGSDFCLVEPGEATGQTDNQVLLYTLRANDEVIISANDLYNGKVIN